MTTARERSPVASVESGDSWGRSGEGESAQFRGHSAGTRYTMSQFVISVKQEVQVFGFNSNGLRSTRDRKGWINADAGFSRYS